MKNKIPDVQNLWGDIFLSKRNGKNCASKSWGDILWAQNLAYLHLNVQNLGGDISLVKMQKKWKNEKKIKKKIPDVKNLWGDIFLSKRNEKNVHPNRGETFYDHKT